jgi:hypothetical protein
LIFDHALLEFAHSTVGPVFPKNGANNKLFPRGATIMKSKSVPGRRGLLAGGNWIIDQVKIIDVFPQLEQLANIRSQSQGTGGAPYNVLLNLSGLGAPFPLSAAGRVGKDALGDQILKDCKRRKIDTRFLKATPQAPTSYTDVMTVAGDGRRTFFHHRGANTLWDGSDLDFQRAKARIFHLGYLLLLDALDATDRKFGTRAARLLAQAREAGLKTSIDVVSEDSWRASARARATATTRSPARVTASTGTSSSGCRSTPTARRRSTTRRSPRTRSSRPSSAPCAGPSSAR